MSRSGAQEIAYRCAIAACNSGPHLRVYVQDVMGNIRETAYEGGWSKGTEKNVIATAKLGSPIAATNKELEHIGVFYLSEDNQLRDVVYEHSKGWHEGNLGKARITVAPYSKLTACFLEGPEMMARMYCQMPDNSIQELGWNGEGSGWKKMQNLGSAMPGTGLACTSFKTSETSIRVYFQTSDGIVEKCFENNKGWYGGSLKVPDVLPRTAMASTSLVAGSNNVGIHLFYATANRLLEMIYDGKKWHDGNIHVDCIPGTEVAAISWGNSGHLNMRVYFQKGELVSGVSEWMWTQGNWKAGKLAIPPA